MTTLSLHSFCFNSSVINYLIYIDVLILYLFSDEDSYISHFVLTLYHVLAVLNKALNNCKVCHSCNSLLLKSRKCSDCLAYYPTISDGVSTRISPTSGAGMNSFTTKNSLIIYEICLLYLIYRMEIRILSIFERI